jgi:hypothetical protein
VIGVVIVAGALAAVQVDSVVLRMERLTNCGRWKVEIRQSGAARGELFNGCHPVTPKQVRVDRSFPGEVPRLRELIEREQFARLDRRPYEANPMVDDAVCVIAVSFGRLRHEVTISGEQMAGSDRELAGFRAIWQTVDKLIPEPEW